MEVPRLGVQNWNYSCRPTPQAQQLGIQTTSVTYTTAHSNTESLTHWKSPGIEPSSSWILINSSVPLFAWQLKILFLFPATLSPCFSMFASVYRGSRYFSNNGFVCQGARWIKIGQDLKRGIQERRRWGKKPKEEWRCKENSLRTKTQGAGFQNLSWSLVPMDNTLYDARPCTECFSKKRTFLAKKNSILLGNKLLLLCLLAFSRAAPG